MSGSVERALRHVRELSTGGPLPPGLPVTLNFHPDTLVDGVPTIELLARDGMYRSQFETGTSNGGMTAFPGGDRWTWESRMFGSAYDAADPVLRPKYGALNHRSDPAGGSRRFGSCHLRLRRHVLERTTFAYPDSHLQPANFGTADRMMLIELADENAGGLDLLDNYVEAHVHGPVRVAEDADAIVLDPSYRGTSIEHAAHLLGCAVEWHSGFRLGLDRLADCEHFRGSIAAHAVARIGVDGDVTPAAIGAVRDTVLDYQTAKWVWHCVARFGQE